MVEDQTSNTPKTLAKLNRMELFILNEVFLLNAFWFSCQDFLREYLIHQRNGNTSHWSLIFVNFNAKIPLPPNIKCELSEIYGYVEFGMYVPIPSC